MVTEVNLEEEIMKLKEELERAARHYQYDFQHPEVIALSQQLDKLITRVMRSSCETKLSHSSRNSAPLVKNPTR